MKKIIIVILTIFLLTGNNDYQELNDLSIVTALAIDYKDNNYLISFQIQNPNNNNKYIIYDSYANTIDKAFNNVLTKSPNKLYYKHLEILYISQTIAKNHMDNIIKYFTENNITRNEFNILINKTNNISTLINEPAINIRNLIKTNTNNIGISQNLKFNDLLNDYLNPYKELTIPSIEIDIDTNNEIKLSTIAIFKNNKLIDYLSEEENIGLNIINNKLATTTLKNNCNNNNYYVTKIHSIKTNLNPDLTNNTINININGKYEINKLNCKNNITELQINDNLKSIITKTINTFKNYNVDTINIQNLYYKKEPNYFKRNYKYWYQHYQNTKTNININLTKDEKKEALGGLYE